MLIWRTISRGSHLHPEQTLAEHIQSIDEIDNNALWPPRPKHIMISGYLSSFLAWRYLVGHSLLVICVSD